MGNVGGGHPKALDPTARSSPPTIRSLDAEADADADAQWEAEIARRSAEVEAGTAPTMTLDEYRAHVRSRRASPR